MSFRCFKIQSKHEGIQVKIREHILCILCHVMYFEDVFLFIFCLDECVFCSYLCIYIYLSIYRAVHSPWACCFTTFPPSPSITYFYASVNYATAFIYQ